MSVQMQSTDATNHHSSTSSTSSENSSCFAPTTAPDHKDTNRDCSSSSSSVAGSMGSAGTTRVGSEEIVGSKGAIAERVVELQNSLRAEKATNIMHQKRIEELERRLCLHTRRHGAAPSSGDVQAQEITISQLTEQQLRYREGLRQVASILKEGLDVSYSSDSEV